VNLQSTLTDDLWAAVETNYSGKNYTGAILDAIYFLSSLIREKTGLESDGVSLVGQAFGGALPKLKVNRLQTESERNTRMSSRFKPISICTFHLPSQSHLTQ